ncbi:MAG TPA: GNAT family N-acetyltransferase [Candidatus Acidoferrales bacterium]|nr:GNAT family N-acetyltransferase [Candidatus Acidoferrales bacterium]
MSTPARISIVLRNCHTLDEFEACVALEKRVWQTADIEIVPSALIRVVAETGGQVLGAFESGRMIGFTFALAGCRTRKGRPEPFLHSHMTAVLPEFQNRGIGRRLKFFQRKEALARGISLIEWTFDPFELRNAHFNVMLLGAVIRRYHPNFYGITTSPLHSGIPTDRLVAEWQLESPRVRAAIEGAAPPPAGHEALRIRVPTDIRKIIKRDREHAISIQSKLRAEFQRKFAANYAVTRVESQEAEVHYVLEPWSDPGNGLPVQVGTPEKSST